MLYVQSSNVRFRDCNFDFSSETDIDRHGIFVNGRGSDVDYFSLQHCSVDADGASLRFADDGERHRVQNSEFGAMVMSDRDTTLFDVLWLGNHHDGRTVFHGERSNWNDEFNWGYDV